MSILIFPWKSQANASLVHSIHANTFTPFTRIVATKVQTPTSEPVRGTDALKGSLSTSERVPLPCDPTSGPSVPTIVSFDEVLGL